jgi:hypothetical protein
MATFSGRLMAAGRQAVTGGLAFKRQTVSTQVYVDTSGTANDVYYFGKLPKGAVICGGRLYSGRLASGACTGSCCVELVLGVDQILANASGSTFSVASLTSGLGHFGPIDYTTASGGVSGTTSKFEAGFTHPLGGLLLTNGPLTVTTDQTNVFATLVVAAGSGSGISGYLNLDLDYITGTYS